MGKNAKLSSKRPIKKSPEHLETSPENWIDSTKWLIDTVVSNLMLVHKNSEILRLVKIVLTKATHVNASTEFLEDTNPSLTELKPLPPAKMEGYRREQVVALAKKITKNLNKSYNCAVVVPVKN